MHPYVPKENNIPPKDEAKVTQQSKRVFNYQLGVKNTKLHVMMF